MTKTNYALEANLTTLTTPLADSISDDLKTLALTHSDNWIESNLGTGISKTTTPASVQEAAEFKSMEFILRTLNDTTEGELPTADWYREEADKLIENYISDEDSKTHPYSSSKTPNGTYLTQYEDDPYSSTRINRRKVINRDSDAWTSED